MIFLTVGTQFPFERLVRTVDQAVIGGMIRSDVVAQIGSTAYEPVALQWSRTIDAPRFRTLVESAEGVIAHAGIGTIISALDARRPVVVLPRLRQYGEHVNDHQVATATRLAARGYILYAKTEHEIARLVEQMPRWQASPTTSELSTLVARVRAFILNTP